MTNRPEFGESVLAANAIGAIAVPVNFRLAPAEAAYILQAAPASSSPTRPWSRWPRRRSPPDRPRS